MAIDRCGWATSRGTTARFDFDEDDRLAVDGDKVDFAVAMAMTAKHYLVA